MAILGKLEIAPLREVWLNEALDFTPWLARPENIVLLSEALNLDLVVEASEASVGPFRADIVCRNAEDDTIVLIENQLERTNHAHLGQLITYAAGTTAATIVWISANFTEEHRAALDWLNEHTSEDLQFFGIQIELWRIGDSHPAPRFNIVSKPNDWTRTISHATHNRDRPMTEMRELQLSYWMNFKEFLFARGSALSIGKPRARSNMVFSIGRTGFWLSAVTQTFENRVRAELYINVDDAKSHFTELRAQADEIEREFGEKLEWDEMPDRKASRVAIYLRDTDPTDQSDWQRQHEWLAARLETLRRVFEPRIRGLEGTEAA